MKKRIITVMFLLLLFPALAYGQEFFYRISPGISFISGIDRLFADYPAVSNSDSFTSLLMEMGCKFQSGTYLEWGLAYIGGSEDVNFYSGYSYNYYLEGLFGSFGGGISLNDRGYFLKVGLDGYLKLYERFKTPEGFQNTDILSDFFPAVSLSLGKELFKNVFLELNYRRNITSVFGSDFNSSNWYNLSLGIEFLM